MDHTHTHAHAIADAPALADRALWVWHGRDPARLASAARQFIVALRTRFPSAGILYIDEQSPADAITSLSRRWLGSEADFIWLHAWQGLSPNSLAIASGCLRAGGVLLLTTPPYSDWPNNPNPQAERLRSYQPSGQQSEPALPHTPYRYVQRLARGLEDIATITCLDAYPDITKFTEQSVAGLRLMPPRTGEIIPSRDQQKAIEAVCRAALGQRRKPALITADRGRGKSAAMGMAAAQLLDEAHMSGLPRSILVTAPDRACAVTVLRHAALSLKQPVAQQLTLGKGTLRYLSVDHVLQAARPDLLLVDEAAGLPVSQLRALIARFPRLAFATTLHGYEGSGRGFALKFDSAIRSHARGVRRCTLDQPIRWRQGDPLERHLNRLLLLDTEPAELTASNTLHDTDIRLISAEALANSEALLRAVFGLLVHAHYRTQPSDCQALLDNPSVRVFVAVAGNQVVGVVQINLEGRLLAADTDALLAGRSRPRGHLLPEVLGSQLGIAAAPALRYARVQRLVVHPGCRRKGLGSRLLEHVSRTLQEHIDCLGVSFGADIDLVRFWHRNRYAAVRLGEKSNAANGLCSALMLRPVNASGAALLETAERRYRAHFVLQVGHVYRYLNPQLLMWLAPEFPDSVDPETMRDLNDFALAGRSFEACLPALHHWLLGCLHRPRFRDQPAEIQTLCVATILQRRSLGHVSDHLGYAGRATLITALRHAVADLLDPARGLPPRPEAE